MALTEPGIQPGDRILFYREGAYTLGLTPNFIRLQPRVYVKSGDSLRIVREAWGTEEWMQKSNLTLPEKNAEQKDTYLFTSAGRRVQLLKDFRDSLGDSARIIVTDMSNVAPSIFVADDFYLAPSIHSDGYVDFLLDICEREHVKAITSLIDPEIEILAENRSRFLEHGVLPLCPAKETAHLCFDKYAMYVYLRDHGIETIRTFATLEDFRAAYEAGAIDFPVFIKPRTGSGSVGAEKILTMADLEDRFRAPKFDYIIQEFMDCEDCDADVYIDAISHQAVAAFSKRKIETKIGGASKTISFKDEKLFAFIQRIVKQFEFNGPVDMDFFCKDGTYYLSEVNPRFGGAYLHAYGSGVDFPRLIRNNIHGITNEEQFGNYEEGTVMLMYDDVIITKAENLAGGVVNTHNNLTNRGGQLSKLRRAVIHNRIREAECLTNHLLDERRLLA